MAFNFNATGLTGDPTIVGNNNFSALFDTIHLYNQILAENGGKLTPVQIIAKGQSIDTDFASKLAIVKNMNGGNIPTRAEEENLLRDYAAWTVTQRKTKNDNYKAAHKDAVTPRQFTYTDKSGQTKTITISPAELKKRATSKAGKVKRVAKFSLRMLLILGGFTLIGGLASSVLFTALGSVFGSAAATPGVLSILANAAGLGTGIFGGVLGNKLYNKTLGHGDDMQKAYRLAYAQNKSEVDNILADEASALMEQSDFNNNFDVSDITATINSEYQSILNDNAAVTTKLKANAVQLNNDYLEYEKSVKLSSPDIYNAKSSARRNLSIKLAQINNPTLSNEEVANLYNEMDELKNNCISDVSQKVIEELKNSGVDVNDQEAYIASFVATNSEYGSYVIAANMVIGELKEEIKRTGTTPTPIDRTAEIAQIQSWINDGSISEHIGDVYNIASTIAVAHTAAAASAPDHASAAAAASAPDPAPKPMPEKEAEKESEKAEKESEKAVKEDAKKTMSETEGDEKRNYDRYKSVLKDEEILRLYNRAEDILITKYGKDGTAKIKQSLKDAFTDKLAESDPDLPMGIIKRILQDVSIKTAYELEKEKKKNDKFKGKDQTAEEDLTEGNEI